MASPAKSSANTNKDNEITTVSLDNATHVPTIIIDSMPDDNDDLPVTPAFPHFPTDEEIVMKPDSIVFVEPTNDQTDQANRPARPSQQSIQILDEIKYLLKSTNSLAKEENSIQASVRIEMNSKIFELFSFCFHLARS